MGWWASKNSGINESASLFLGYLLLQNMKKKKKVKDEREVEAGVGDRNIFMLEGGGQS